MRDLVKRQLDYGENPVYYREISGTSLETKPTDNVAGGSMFVETDTPAIYVFDETSETWTKMFDFGA